MAKKSSDDRINELVEQHVNDLVAALADAIRAQFAEDVLALAAGRGRVGRSGIARRILPCIAPGCQNPSKGPRFHYLCDEHRGASKKEYDEWRLARKTATRHAGDAGKPAPAMRAPEKPAARERKPARKAASSRKPPRKGAKPDRPVLRLVKPAADGNEK